MFHPVSWTIFPGLHWFRFPSGNVSTCGSSRCTCYITPTPFVHQPPFDWYRCVYQPKPVHYFLPRCYLPFLFLLLLFLRLVYPLLFPSILNFLHYLASCRCWLILFSLSTGIRPKGIVLLKLFPVLQIFFIVDCLSESLHPLTIVNVFLMHWHRS